MKHLKLFQTEAEYTAYKNGGDFVTPNVSYIVENNIVSYNPFETVKSGVIVARYNATEENKLAIADTSNVKSLKVNGQNVEFTDTYYFSEVGEYDVEIELIDTTLINGANMNSDIPPKSMFWGILNDQPTGACLTSVILPEGIITIGAHAFCECLQLTSAVIPDSVITIDANAFCVCSNLNDIHIGSGVTTIGYCAFDRCTSLPIIDGIRYADTCLVEANNKTLTAYNIKEGTKFIGDGAFAGCLGLTSISIPDSVITIGYYAFQNCSNLTSITIPDSVASIGFRAFNSCLSLNDITCLSTTAPNIQSDTFANVKENGILKVPAGSDYSSWMSTDEYYLGYYNWTVQEI